MHSNSKRIRSFSTAALPLCLCFAVLQGCVSTRLVRDQSQIDPLLLDDGVTGLPQAVLPRCDLGFWIRRASDTMSTEKTIACKSSRGQSKDVDVIAPTAFPNLSIDPITRRSQAQAELMAISDLDCTFYQSGIFGTQAGLNLGTSLTSAGLSGIATLVTGRAAQNLSAASAFLNTTRATINSEVYSNYVAPALIAEINANRSEVRRRIIAKRHCAIVDYPPAQAVNDVLNYHESCSYISGLTSLLQKAGVQQRTGDPAEIRNAAQIQAHIAQIAAEITAITASSSQETDAVKLAKIKQNLADKQAELATLKRIAAYVGTPAPNAVGHSPISFTGQIAELREVVAIKQSVFEIIPDLPADKKLAAATALQTAKDKLAQKLIDRMQANELERMLAKLKEQLSVEDDASAKTALTTKIATTIKALVNLGATDQVLSNVAVDQGCGGN